MAEERAREVQCYSKAKRSIQTPIDNLSRPGRPLAATTGAKDPSVTNKKRPVVLVVLDGWGYRAERDGNAIALASTPTWDALSTRNPMTLLDASGLAVGLPEGQIGNSEVGHLNLGAGRVVMQDLVRINTAISDG